MDHVVGAPNIRNSMKEYQVRHIQMIFMSMFIDKDNISTNVDTWWQFLQAIEYLTEKHKKMIAYLICKVLEKTILDYCPQNTKAGGMTQTSSIESKP